MSWSRRYPAYIFEITDSKIILRHDSPDHRCATLIRWCPARVARSPRKSTKFAQNRVVLRHSRLAQANHIAGGPPGSELRDPANYRCSLGTNTVLGLVTNGLLAVSRDGGAENCSFRPPGSPKMVPPDCPFDILSASSSGSASRLFIVAGSTGCVVNAEVLCVPKRRATTPATKINALLIGPPQNKINQKLTPQGWPWQVADRQPGSILVCLRRKRVTVVEVPPAEQLRELGYILSKAEINREPASKMSHQSPRDDSTIIISAAPKGRAVSRWNWSRRASWSRWSSAAVR